MAERISEEKKELATTLVKAGKPFREVAEVLQISIGSVHNISSEPYEDIAPIVDEIKKRSAFKHYLLSDYILSSISELNLTYASLKDKVLASAILTDKARVLDDEQKKDRMNRMNTSDEA